MQCIVEIQRHFWPQNVRFPFFIYIFRILLNAPQQQFEMKRTKDRALYITSFVPTKTTTRAMRNAKSTDSYAVRLTNDEMVRHTVYMILCCAVPT